MSSKKLIEQVLSGQSARHLFDALVEELPPTPTLIASIRRELPRNVDVRLEHNICFISPRSDTPRISEQVSYLSLVWPEIEFVVE
jgi:hypothetical protein